tara:strand:+ start:138 stop:350 length:213 start_codon:yes stop_codon:yes gene_type:complete
MKMRILLGALVVGFALSGCTGGGGLLDDEDRADLTGGGSFGQTGNMAPILLGTFRTPSATACCFQWINPA